MKTKQDQCFDKILGNFFGLTNSLRLLPRLPENNKLEQKDRKKSDEKNKK